MTIDAGAVAALRDGRSLLPAGVIKVEGKFASGDAVSCAGPMARKSAAGSPPTTPRTPTRSKAALLPTSLSILGFGGRSEIIHRDDLVIGRE